MLRLSINFSSVKNNYPLLLLVYDTKTNYTMKKSNILFPLLAMLVLSSCSAIEGIFKAGAIVGIIAVLIVIGIIFWIISMFNK